MQKETSKKFSSETSFSKNVVLKDNVREPLSKLAHTTSSHALTYVLEGLNKKHSQSLCNLTYQVNKELTLVERYVAMTPTSVNKEGFHLEYVET